jgi:hypothetical protein
VLQYIGNRKVKCRFKTYVDRNGTKVMAVIRLGVDGDTRGSGIWLMLMSAQ